jgi:hypothetical protein
MMAVSQWTESDTVKAEQIWSEYQKAHDLSHDMGKTVGIDPRTGRVWIGGSILDVIAQRNADGIESLLFFERVGSKTYYRKGGRR